VNLGSGGGGERGRIVRGKLGREHPHDLGGATATWATRRRLGNNAASVFGGPVR
jgi:hypothetical protein